METLSEKNCKLTIKKPSDMHIHLRQGEFLKTTVRDAQKWFCQGVVMPNTATPITTPDLLTQYRDEIAEITPDFKPLMTFKLYPGMKKNVVKKLAEAGAIAGKLYPIGVTTNSEDGIKSWRSIKASLTTMSELGLILSVHGEKPGFPSLDREYKYHRDFLSIVKAFPDLKIVFEHISDRRSVDLVAGMGDNIVATITAHHIFLTIDDIIGNKICPHNFCKPIAKTEKDRAAIAEAALSGNPKFFFGSDSAPHWKENKESNEGSAGIYSAPCAIPLLIDFFESAGKLNMLENFVSIYGPFFYQLPKTEKEITLEKESFTISESEDNIVPFKAGETVSWSYPRGVLKTIISGNYTVN